MNGNEVLAFLLFGVLVVLAVRSFADFSGIGLPRPRWKRAASTHHEPESIAASPPAVAAADVQLAPAVPSEPEHPSIVWATPNASPRRPATRTDHAQGLAIGFLLGLGAQILVFGAASTSDPVGVAAFVALLPVVGVCVAAGLLGFSGWIGAVVGTVVAWILVSNRPSDFFVTALLMLPSALILGFVVAAIRLIVWWTSPTD
jgi:hypothetical protein